MQVYASGFAGDYECWRSYEHEVHSLMQQALGEKVKLVRVIWRNTASECNLEDVWEHAVKPNFSMFSTVFNFIHLVIFSL